MNNQNITVACIQDTESFSMLQEPWDQLLIKSQEKDVFLTWEWLYAWWKNIGQTSHQLRIYTAHENGRMIGILPCMLSVKTKSTVRLKWLESLGHPDCDVGGLISTEPDVTAVAIVEYLARHGDTWDILEIHELPSSSQSITAIKNALDGAGIRFVEEVEDHYFINTEGSWEEYYNNLSKNMRHNLKRRTKRAVEMGDVQVKRYVNVDLKWEHFQTVFEISEKSNFQDLYKTSESRSFHRGLFELMRNRGWIQIELLYLNETPIAFQYGFVFEGRYEDWRGGMDKDYDFIAPSKLLFMLSLEDRFNSGIRENDFLRGLHAYKKDWLPQSREFTRVIAFNSKSLKARLSYIWMVRIKGLITPQKGFYPAD